MTSSFNPDPDPAARVEHLQPSGLIANPAFSQVVVVSGAARTIYVGGQNAVTASGEIVGRGDLGAQTQQIFANLKTALAAAGAGLEHVIKWNIAVVQGQSLGAAVAVFQREWGPRPNPPLITLHIVAGLAHPDYLAEIDAIAVVP
jgi:enamine deaminase RidA (YjgF/YER057c/UK114 family)